MRKLLFLISLISIYLCGIAQESSDKTLVAWVNPDNTDQQGGSVLTVQKGDEFDAIVFGEILKDRWMAGSNNFNRTLKEQIDLDQELVLDRQFLQLAIVYEQDQISIFKNGALYSSHEAQNIDLLSSEYNFICFGLRHIGAAKGHFSGLIDDARIYARALSAAELNSLKANQRSDIKPYAWWNFENNEVRDLTGTFKYSKIVGDTEIHDGKLKLQQNSLVVACRNESDAEKASQGKVPEVPMPPWEGETPEMPKEISNSWLSYHLAHPGPGEAMPGDPNCAFFYEGKYHLHYIYKHRHGFAFAHVSSEDMVHWKWHPTSLVKPNTGHGMFSGTGFFTKEGKPAIIYHGQGADRNYISFALDNNLDVWSEPFPVLPKTSSGQDVEMRHWDPDCWLNGDYYYAISGGAPPSLLKSFDLKNWSSLGLLLHDDMPDLGVSKNEDISCANMFRIGNKWMLLCISHSLGCRYYLGDFEDEKFLPDFHAMMNWNGWDFFAPESLLTPDGRRVMWAWCLLDGAQSGIQSLPRELSLPEDGVLRIKPLKELEKLRYDEQFVNDILVRSGTNYLLKSRGDVLEMMVSFDSKHATEYGMIVFADSAGQGLKIHLRPEENLLVIGDKNIPFMQEQSEKVQMRVFLDHGMVEVFVNDKQAANYMQAHAESDINIQLFSQGSDVRANVSTWKMKSIYE